MDGNKKSKKIIVILLGVCAILIIGIILLNIIQKDSPSSTTLDPKKDIANTYLLGLLNKDLKLEDYSFSLNNLTEWDSTLQFICNQSMDHSFIMAVYINYQRVDFSIQDSTASSTDAKTYKFNAENGETKRFKIKIPVSQFPYKQNAVLITINSGAGKFATDYPNEHYLDISYARYTISNPYTAQERPQSNITVLNQSQLFDASFYKPTMNNNVDDIAENRAITGSLNVKKNQLTSFGVRLSGNMYQNFILIMDLGHEQTAINGKIYEEYQMPSKKNGLCKLEFQTPNVTDIKDVQVLVVPNPWMDMKDLSTTFYQVDKTERITLNLE